MEKGKFGIRLSFYAVVAFALVIFGYDTLLFLLAGVVLLAEKNEWATRQVIQAICLSFVVNILSSVLNVFNFIYKIPFIGSAWSSVISVLTSLVDLAVLVFAVIAIINTAKGKEAGIPLANKFADWAYGKIVVKPQPVYQQPVYQQPMQAQAPYQQPVQPVQAQAQPEAQPVVVCTNCGTPLNGGAFCTKCGTPAAK